MTITQDTIKANPSAEHAEKKRKLRGVWTNMKQRCYNPNATGYAGWGGRGIRVCDEWLESSDAFVTWGLANGYAEGLTIERTNNNAGYSPENCKWATHTEQNVNQRMQRNNTSGISGVGWEKSRKKWCAQISVADKNHNLGRFTRSIEAAAARNQYIIDNDLLHKLYTIELEGA